MDGPIKKGKTSFSLNVGGMDSFDTETIRSRERRRHAVRRRRVAADRSHQLNARVEHAINKNQMLRVEYSRNSNDQGQLGVGGFDLYERAYDRAASAATSSASRPAARCSARCATKCASRSTGTRRVSTSLSDAVTIRVQDAFTTRRRAGRRRPPVEDDRVRRQPRLHPRQEARAARRRPRRRRLLPQRRDAGTSTAPTPSPRTTAFEAGQPQQFSQRIGDPLVEYRSFQFGAYLQDDFRVQKNLMVSYGLRYEAQTHLGDNINLSPRVSFAWTPFKSGSTTVRGGFGVFNDWYEDSLYEQALRLDGEHQRDLIVRNPTYPTVDLSARGAAAAVGDADRGRPGDAADHARLVRRRARLRQLGAVPQQLLHPAHDDEFRAVNLNAPVNGVRPFPDLGNITYVDAIGEAKSQGVDLSMNLNYAPKRIFGADQLPPGEGDERRRQRDQPADGRQRPRGRVGPGARRRPAPHLRLRRRRR